MVQERETILITGGGLGGLTTAAALGKSGRRVTVLEQASEISPIGYGIQLGPNVFDVFERLGVAEAVKAASDLPSRLVMLDADSEEKLMEVPLTSDEYRQRFK